MITKQGIFIENLTKLLSVSEQGLDYNPDWQY